MLVTLQPLLLTGRTEKEEPKRMNGTLKKVWRCMDNQPLEWVSVKKPALPSEQKESGSPVARAD